MFHLDPGTSVRWWRKRGNCQYPLLDATVVRRLTRLSVLIRLPDGREKRVLAENLMPAGKK